MHRGRRAGPIGVNGEGDHGSTYRTLAGILDSVAVRVEPNPVADLDGSFVAKGFNVAEAVGLAEEVRAVRLQFDTADSTAVDSRNRVDASGVCPRGWVDGRVKDRVANDSDRSGRALRVTVVRAEQHRIKEELAAARAFVDVR